MVNEVVSFGSTVWEQGAQQRVTHEGIIALEDATIVIEVRTRRHNYGTFTTTEEGTRSWRVPLESIDGAEVRDRWLGWGGVSLRIRTRSLTLLDGLPGCVGREFRANVPRGERDAARALAAHVADLLADRMLRRLDLESGSDELRRLNG